MAKSSFLFVNGNIRAIERAIREEPKIAKGAAVSALNKLTKLVQTEGIRTVAKLKKLPTRAVKSRTRFSPANYRRMHATLITLNEGFPIDRLAPRDLKKGGFSAAGKKFPDAFRTFGRSGTDAQRRLIFQRVTPGTHRSKGRPASSPANLPIERVKIPLQPEIGSVFSRLVRSKQVSDLGRLFKHEVERRRGRV
jgi:hypothetical protein